MTDPIARTAGRRLPNCPPHLHPAAAAEWRRIAQIFAFLIVALFFGVRVPWPGWFFALLAMVPAAMMLGAIGLALSVRIRQLENFAGTMNFVIFPIFFISTALYPLWKLRESAPSSSTGSRSPNPSRTPWS